MKLSFAIMFGLCASLLQVQARAEAPEDYRYRLPLTLQGDGPWYRLTLPFAVQQAASHDDLRDLRVFNAAGEPLAFSLQHSSGQQAEQRSSRSVPLFALQGPAQQAASAARIRVQRATDGTLVELLDGPAHAESEVLRGWLLDVSAIEQPLIELELDWQAEDGFQRFSIEASDDLQHWRALGEGQLVRLTTAGERIEQRHVRLPGQRARYLRLLWRDAPAVPLSNAVVHSATAEWRAAELAWSDVLTGQRLDSGEYQWELPRALPVSRLRLALEQPNMLLPLRVQSRREGQPHWQGLAAGVLYRVPGEQAESRNDELALPGRSVQQLRLHIDARGGGLGNQPAQLQLALPGRELLFLVRGAGPYQLALGQAQAEPASLPLSTLLGGRSQPLAAQTGEARLTDMPQQLAEVASEQASERLGGAGQRLVLWVILLLGVALLGGMAWSLLRDKGRTPGPPSA